MLPLERVLTRRDDHLVVRSPHNPGHYWGNLLLFDSPPRAGDGRRWTEAFEAEFADDRRVAHRTFAWEGVHGELGVAREEFVAAGYELEQMVGLIAGAEQLRRHPREHPTVRVRALDPAAGADERLWGQVVELQVASRDERFEEEMHRAHCRSRQSGSRALFGEGRGAWFVALDEAGAEVLGKLRCRARRWPRPVSAGRHGGRAQTPGHLLRLVVEAARLSGARLLVICADPGYHALGLYESLGFHAAERVAGVCLQPPASG